MDDSKKTPPVASKPDQPDLKSELIPDSTPLLALDDNFFSEETIRDSLPSDALRTGGAPLPASAHAPETSPDRTDFEELTQQGLTQSPETWLDAPHALLEPSGPPLAEFPPPVVPPVAEPTSSPQQAGRAENAEMPAESSGYQSPATHDSAPDSAFQPKNDAGEPHPAEQPIPLAAHAVRFPPFVLDCSRGRFALSPGQFEPLQDDEIPSNWHALITDFHAAPGPGVMLVDAAPKYAHVLAQRILQRNGELTEDLELHILAKKKTGVQTLLAYQLVPKQQRARLEALGERSSSGFLLHDSVTLLQGLLPSRPRGQTVTLILHLPLTLILMSGRNGDILWTRRFALSDDHGPDFRASVSAAMHEMRQAERDLGFDVDHTVWIEGWSQAPMRPPEQSQPMEVLPVRAMHHGSEIWHTALPDLIGRLDDKSAFTPVADRTLARLQPWEKWLWATTLAAGLFLGGAGWWLHGEAERIEHDGKLLQSHKTDLLSTLNALALTNRFPDQDREALARGLETAQKLRQAQSAPPAALLWNTVARLRPPSCRVQALEITYAADLVRVRLEGSIELGLTQAQAVYTDFLKSLDRAGLRVVQQDFRLDLDTNFFSLMLEQGAKE